MAEIKITKKTPVWPWILLLLLVIGGVFFLFVYGSADEDDLTDDDSTEIEEITLFNSQPSDAIPLLSTEDS